MVKPAPKKAVKSAPKKIAKPVAKKVAKPAPKKVAKPIAKKVVAPKKAATKKIQSPVVKAPAKPMLKKVEKPAVKPVAVKPVVAKPEAIKPAKQDKKITPPAPQQDALPEVYERPVVPQKSEPSAMARAIETGVRYSDKDLKEFELLIHERMKSAKSDLEDLRQSLSHAGDNSTDDTAPTFKMMEDGSDSMNREELGQLAARQEKFIQSLENALLRIKNKTYGICRGTGKLIPKERLKLVPHATLSMEAKIKQ